MAGLDELYPNGGLFGTGFMMWGFNGTARVLIEYTEKASNKHLLLEPVDVKKDRYGFVYAPTRNGDVPYDPVRNASAYHTITLSQRSRLASDFRRTSCIVLAKNADIQRSRMRHSGPAGFKWLPIALASLVLCSGCSFVPRPSKLSGNRAFIDYWPPNPNSKRTKARS